MAMTYSSRVLLSSQPFLKVLRLGAQRAGAAPARVLTPMTEHPIVTNVVNAIEGFMKDFRDGKAAGRRLF